MEPITMKRPIGLVVVSVLMVLFGLAEVVTGFTHSFFGINTSTAAFFTYSAAAIGVFYAAAGVLTLAMRKPAAAIAIALLIIDVIGRLALVATGFYPTDTLRNTFSIIAGTAIVILFAIYIGWKWKAFQ
jgi:hypothetical protein